MAAKLATASVILLVLSAVFLLLAIFFFLLFNIPSVISDLSGRTAKKSILKLRAANEKSSNKFYGSSERNKERGKLTDSIKQTGKSSPKDAEKRKAKKQDKKGLVFASMDDRPETGLLAENHFDQGTTGNETTALSADGETDELFPQYSDDGSTMELDGAENTAHKPVKRTGGIKLTVLDEVILIHTDEVI